MKLTRVNIMGKLYEVCQDRPMPLDAEGKPKGKGLPHDRRGECDPPTKKGKAIRILDDLKGQERLEILVHEFMHAADWHKDEEWVGKFGKDMARYLWKLGYRLERPPTR